MMLALSWEIQASQETPRPTQPDSFESPYSAILSELFYVIKPYT
jgi:hypothetical protein